VTSSKQQRPFASVAKGGKLLPEVERVIAIIAKNNLVLATGHSSPAEALLLIREAKRQGVRGVVVTHANNRLVGMTIPQMQEAAKLGAFIEFVRVTGAAVAEHAKALREVGPEFSILSSDLGQATNPLHPDGLLTLFEELKKYGITDSEIDRMAKANPARLLGLQP
jgi:predicted metal-dependent phosphotriesterase family hydrolase